MVKHIVFWKLKERAAGASRAENARLLKERLEALDGRIPGMLRAEVGIDFDRSAGAWDVALYSEFESREALDVYQDHPEHVAVKDFVLEVREDRAVVDYEV